MPRSVHKLILMMISAIALGACASTSVKESWVNPDMAGKHLGKTLVIAVFDDELRRSHFETELAAMLAKHSVNAVPRANLRALSGKPGRERIEEVVKSEGFDHVLVTRLADLTDDEVTRTGYSEYESSGFRGQMGRYWATGLNVQEHEPYAEQHTRLYVETSAFEGVDGAVVWRTRSQTRDPQMVDLSSELAAAITSRLRRDSLIR